MPAAALVKMEADDAPPLADGNYGVLPADVLYDILLCLPADHLCRLRLVCRSWRSLTSDPLFARAHSSRHPHVAALHRQLQELHVVDLHEKIVVKRIHLTQPGACLGAQHNLVCVAYSHLTAWGRAGVLSLQQGTAGSTIADIRMERHVPSGCRMPPTCMLGHVPSTGEYKVLRLWLYLSMAPDNFMAVMEMCHVMTFGGSGDGSWREMRRKPPLPPATNSCRVAVVAGVAYFLVDQSRSDMVPDNVASLDLATEEWRSRILHGPVQPSTRDEHRFLFMLVELGDCLVMVHDNLKDLITDLWFIEDMNKSLWTKRCSIRWGATLGIQPTGLVWPLMVSDDGRIVFSVNAGGRVIGAYDPRTSTWVDLAKMQDYCTVAMHQGSLLYSLNGY